MRVEGDVGRRRGGRGCEMREDNEMVQGRMEKRMWRERGRTKMIKKN